MLNMNDTEANQMNGKPSLFYFNGICDNVEYTNIFRWLLTIHGISLWFTIDKYKKKNILNTADLYT